MFIALGVLLFVLGFVTALLYQIRRPYRGANGPEETLEKARHIVDGLTKDSWQCAVQEAVVDNAAMNKINATHLLTRQDVETRFDAGSWQKLAYDDFVSTILAKGAGNNTFPCVYATIGFRSNDHRYVFLESDDPSEPRNIRIIAPALEEYLDTSHQLGPNTSLVIICGASKILKSVEDYNRHFWDMLRGLRIRDTKPWPSEIPQETDSEKWMFCFEGQPLFPVMLTPAHQRRWSRHMSVPVIAMQPKWVLDNLLATPEKRESATAKVRKLLSEYDQVEISPDLTSYGQPGTSEVRQLCLLDENETAECPYQNFDR